MLAFLTILFMLIVAYSFWGEGVHTAFCMLVNVIVAGLVAFTFFEPLADFLEPTFSNTFLEGYEDFLSLMVVFAAALGGLRFATNYLVTSAIDYHPLLRQLGSRRVRPGSRLLPGGVPGMRLPDTAVVCEFHGLR